MIRKERTSDLNLFLWMQLESKVKSKVKFHYPQMCRCTWNFQVVYHLIITFSYTVQKSPVTQKCDLLIVTSRGCLTFTVQWHVFRVWCWKAVLKFICWRRRVFILNLFKTCMYQRNYMTSQLVWKPTWSSMKLPYLRVMWKLEACSAHTNKNWLVSRS